jgi:hypothetical protein
MMREESSGRPDAVRTFSGRDQGTDVGVTLQRRIEIDASRRPRGFIDVKRLNDRESKPNLAWERSHYGGKATQRMMSRGQRKDVAVWLSFEVTRRLRAGQETDPSPGRPEPRVSRFTRCRERLPCREC